MSRKDKLNEVSKLKSTVIEQIKNDNNLKAMLMMKFNNSMFTIDRWILENDVMLTTYSSLTIIRVRLGYMSNEDLLELPHPNGSQIEDAMACHSSAEKRG